MKAAFAEFDKDHTGWIARDELKNIMCSLGSSLSYVPCSHILIISAFDLVLGEKMTDAEAEEMMKEAEYDVPWNSFMPSQLAHPSNFCSLFLVSIAMAR